MAETKIEWRDATLEPCRGMHDRRYRLHQLLCDGDGQAS